MKKLLLLLLAATTIFSSCSSDSDSINNGGDSNVNAKKYTVNLNVKSAGFEVDKTPMKSADEKVRKIFQYVIYNEDGSVYSDSLYIENQVPPMINDQGEINIQLQLPEGKYHLAILYMPTYNIRQYPEDCKLSPKNFNTDYYSNTPPLNMRWDNQNVFYQVTDLNVLANEDNSINSIELEPMWSEVELKLSDIQTSKVPDETEALIVYFTPSYSGFGIKSKTASFVIPKDTIRASLVYPTKSDTLTINYLVAKGVDNSMGISIHYVKKTSTYSNFTTISKKEIKLENKLENGYHYKIGGKLGNYDGYTDNNNQSFNISLGDFNKEDVNIEF